MNRIGDRFAADQKRKQFLAQQDVQHRQDMEDLRLRAQREKEKSDLEKQIEVDKQAAISAKVKAWMDRRDLQVARLGIVVHDHDFSYKLEDIRTNPFRFMQSPKPLIVMHLPFNRMLSMNQALFGNEANAVILKVDDVQSFTTSGQHYMVSFYVADQTEAEQMHETLGDAVVSIFVRPPVYGDSVKAYACPENDCVHLFDLSEVADARR